jgi:hypothetical protein
MREHPVWTGCGRSFIGRAPCCSDRSNRSIRSNRPIHSIGSFGERRCCHACKNPDRRIETPTLMNPFDSVVGQWRYNGIPRRTPRRCRVYDRRTVRTSFVRTVALVVACVFASLPTLARVHERLAARHAVSSFRLSKNVERPHDKVAPAPLVRTAVPLAARDDSIRGSVDPAAHRSSDCPALSSVVTRAPPAR